MLVIGEKMDLILIIFRWLAGLLVDGFRAVGEQNRLPAAGLLELPVGGTTPTEPARAGWMTLRPVLTSSGAPPGEPLGATAPASRPGKLYRLLSVQFDPVFRRRLRAACATTVLPRPSRPRWG